jgi:hypothetical protein
MPATVVHSFPIHRAGQVATLLASEVFGDPCERRLLGLRTSPFRNRWWRNWRPWMVVGTRPAAVLPRAFPRRTAALQQVLPTRLAGVAQRSSLWYPVLQAKGNNDLVIRNHSKRTPQLLS